MKRGQLKPLLRRTMALLIALVMAIGAFPAGVYAAQGQDGLGVEPLFDVGPPYLSLGIIAVPHGEAPPSTIMLGTDTVTINWSQETINAVMALAPFHLAPNPSVGGGTFAADATFYPLRPAIHRVVARFIAIPTDTHYYIDSIGHFQNPTGAQIAHNALNGITPAWQAVSSLLGNQLINSERADQIFTDDAVWGHLPANPGIRNIMDGGRGGEPNRMHDPWMYGLMDGATVGANQGQILYHMALPPGEWTLTSGHQEWWANQTRNKEAHISIDDGYSWIPLGAAQGSLPLNPWANPAQFSTRTATVDFTLYEPTTVIYRIQRVAGAGGGNPIVSWVAVNGTPEDTQRVTLNANSGLFGDESAVREINLLIRDNTYAELYFPANVPERGGFVFDGWFTAAEGGIRINEDTPVTTAEARTLFAQWQPDGEAGQRMTLVANGGRFGIGEQTHEVFVNYPGNYADIFIPANTPTRPGYNFIGWFTAATGGVQIFADTSVTTAATRTLYAQWEAGNTVQVTFDMNRYFYTGGNNERGVTHPTLRRPLRETIHLTVGADYGEFFDEAYDALIARHRAFNVAIGMGLNAPGSQGAGWNTANNSNASLHNRLGPVDLERHFNFIGWFTAPEGGTQVMPDDTITEVPRTLYAQWAVPVVIDGNDILDTAHLTRSLTYKGAGVLSANSTSALLMDYKYMNPDAYRELLEILFGGDRPLMHRVKVEIGNDRNTSTGPDPSTRRYLDDPVNVARHPGFQLMADAIAVNPGVRTSILRWTLPPFAEAGAGNWEQVHRDRMWEWYRDLLLEVYRQYGFMITYIAPDQNEGSPGRVWGHGFLDFHMDFANRIATEPSSTFQSQQEEALFRQVRITASDEYTMSNIGPRLVHGTTGGTQGGINVPARTGAELRAALPAVNYHYAFYDDNVEYRIYYNPATSELIPVAVGPAASINHVQSLIPTPAERANWEYQRTIFGSFTVLSDIFNIEVWNSEKQATFGNTAFRPNNTIDNNIRSHPDPTHGEPAFDGSTGIGGIISALEMGNAQIKGFAESRRTHFIYQPAISAHYYGGEWGFKELVAARDPWSGWIHYDPSLYILRHFSWFAEESGWNDFDLSGNPTTNVWHAIPAASGTTSVLRSPAHSRDGSANFMTLAPRDASEFSTVIINDSPFPRTYTLDVRNMNFSGSALPTLEVWETRAADTQNGEAFNANYMQFVGTLTADAETGIYALVVNPWSIVTVTTLDNRTWMANNGFGPLPVPETRAREVLDLRETVQQDRHSAHIQSAVANWTDGTANEALDMSNVLWADSFNYVGRQVPTQGLGVNSSADSAAPAGFECFMVSRGFRELSEFAYPRSQQGFYPLLFHNRQGALEVVNNPIHGWVLRQALDRTTRGGTGGAWHGGDPIASVGDYRWMNYRASVDIAFRHGQINPPAVNVPGVGGSGSSANYAAIGIRFQGGGFGTPNHAHDGMGARTPYFLYFRPDGVWSLRSWNWGTTLASGNIATMVDEADNLLFPNFVPNQADQWVNLAVQGAGNRISAYINGIEVAVHYDESNLWRSGRVQLGSGFYHTYFRNLLVETVDGFAPYYSYVKDDLEMHDLSQNPQQRLTYNNQWIHTSGRGMYNIQRTLSESVGAGATLEYTFTGTGIDLLGYLGGGGTAADIAVFLDDTIFIPTVRGIPSQNFFQTLVIRGLPYGEHTVRFEVLENNRFIVDGVAVVSGAVTAYDAIDNTRLESALYLAEQIITPQDISAQSLAAFLPMLARSSMGGGGTDAFWEYFVRLRQHARDAISNPAAYRLCQEGSEQIADRLLAAMGLVEVIGVIHEITGIPESVLTRDTIDLNVVAEIVPASFFHPPIVWQIVRGDNFASLTNGILSFSDSGIVQLRATVPGGLLDGSDFVQNFEIVVNSYQVVHGFFDAADIANFGVGSLDLPQIRVGIGGRSGGFLANVNDWWSGINNGNSQNAGGNRGAFIRVTIPENINPEEVYRLELHFTNFFAHNQGNRSLSLFSLLDPLPEDLGPYHGVLGAAANTIKARYPGRAHAATSIGFSAGSAGQQGAPVIFDLSEYVRANPQQMYEFTMLADANMLDLFGVTAANEAFRPQWVITVAIPPEFETPTYSVELTAYPENFPPITLGEALGDEHEIEISVVNTGNRETGTLAITVDTTLFTVNPINLTSIEPSQTARFTITPTPLAAQTVGTHTAVITVANGVIGDGAISEYITLSFVVNEQPPEAVVFSGNNPNVLKTLLEESDVILETAGNLGIFAHHSPFVIPEGRTLTVVTTLNVQGNAELIIEGTLIVLDGGRVNNQGGAGGTIRITEIGTLVNYGHVENVTNSTVINYGTIENNGRFEVRASTRFHSCDGYVIGEIPLNIHRNAITCDND